MLRLALAALLAVALIGCADRNPPRWPSDGELAAEIADGVVTLRWAPATDDREVAGYELSSNGTVVAELAPTVTSHRLTGLRRGAELSFRLIATDAAEHRSEALVTTVRLEPEAPAPQAARAEAPHAEAPAEPEPEAPAAEEVADAVRPEAPTGRHRLRLAHPPEMPRVLEQRGVAPAVTLQPRDPNAQLRLSPALRTPSAVVQQPAMVVR